MFYFLFLLLIGGTLTVLALQNLNVLVHITFFMWTTPDLPLGLWLVAAFLLGALLLYIISLFSAWSDRREARRLRARVAELEQHAASPQPVSQGPITPAPMPGMSPAMPAAMSAMPSAAPSAPAMPGMAPSMRGMAQGQATGARFL